MFKFLPCNRIHFQNHSCKNAFNIFGLLQNLYQDVQHEQVGMAVVGITKQKRSRMLARVALVRKNFDNFGNLSLLLQIKTPFSLGCQVANFPQKN